MKESHKAKVHSNNFKSKKLTRKQVNMPRDQELNTSNWSVHLSNLFVKIPTKILVKSAEPSHVNSAVCYSEEVGDLNQSDLHR